MNKEEKYHRFSLNEYESSSEEFSIKKINGSCRAEKTHSHDFIQIYHIKKGILRHELEGAEVDLVRGDMFIIPPGICHRIKFMEKCTEFVAISFKPSFISYSPRGSTFIDRFISFLMIDYSAGRRVNTRPVVRLDTFCQAMADQDVSLIMREYDKKDEGYQEIIKGILQKLVIMIGRIYLCVSCCRENAAKYDAYNESMLKCIVYIDRTYMKKLKINDMSRKFCISRTYFCKFFKNYTGMSFNKYINYRRILNAKEILQNFNCSISDTAAKVGYNNMPAFYRNFKEIIGTTPGSLKKKLDGRLE